jgi:hypothetical protein
MKKSRFTDGQIFAILKQAENGPSGPMAQPVKGSLRRFAPLTGLALRPFRACDGGSGGMKTFRFLNEGIKGKLRNPYLLSKQWGPPHTVWTFHVEHCPVFFESTAEKRTTALAG